MFSHRQLVWIGIVFFVAVNFTVITLGRNESLPFYNIERFFISMTSPVQLAASKTIYFTRDIWNTYFMTVLAVQENIELKKRLVKAVEVQNRCKEMEFENIRLRKLVDFKDLVSATYVAARVIARDPSPWFKTIMINKGEKDGLVKGSPVLVSEGIVGQIIMVAHSYSKVLLITDRNSAVDALVQNSRVRGIVKGNNTEKCSFVYALRKDEVQKGEMIISSGLDQVFPKGVRIGRVLKVTKLHSQLFQDIVIETSVDFDKIEEVLVLRSAE